MRALARLRRRFASSSRSKSSESVENALRAVKDRMGGAAARSNRSPDSVDLIAVSKTKPSEMIQAAYDAGQRQFGENYAQELVAKAPELPDDVEWHFIGKLQSNKASMLVSSVPNLKAVHTVHSAKLARKLGDACAKTNRRLDVYVQVDTSGEATKNGIEPGPELVTLVETIHSSNEQSMQSLDFKGLMTIGAPGDVGCFETLAQARESVSEALGLDPSEIRLSMGMSEAITYGSNAIRVGSTIFGARDYPAQP